MFDMLRKWNDARLARKCVQSVEAETTTEATTDIITHLHPDDARWWHETLTTLLKGQIVLPINVSTDKGLPWSDADSGLPWTDHEGIVKEVKLGICIDHVSIYLPCGHRYSGADIEIVPTKKTVFVRSMVGKNVCVWMLQVLTDIFPHLDGLPRSTYWSRFGPGEINAWRAAINEQWQHRRSRNDDVIGS